jgi:hypothetical protein
MNLADKHEAVVNLTTKAKDLQSRLLHGSTHTKPAFRKRIQAAMKLRARYENEIARTESCRALCDKIQAILPREIRDMIYEYVFEAQNVAFDHPVASVLASVSATMDLEYPDRVTLGSLPSDCDCPACT